MLFKFSESNVTLFIFADYVYYLYIVNENIYNIYRNFCEIWGRKLLISNEKIIRPR